MALKDPIKNIKIQSIAWVKIFMNHISDKVLVSRMHRELLQFDNKKTIQLKKK